MTLTGPATPDDEPAKDNTFIAALYFQCKDAGDFYFCPVGSIDQPFLPGEKRCGHCIHLDTIERFLAQRLLMKKAGSVCRGTGPGTCLPHSCIKLWENHCFSSKSHWVHS
jgi:hypothetical protein